MIKRMQGWGRIVGKEMQERWKGRDCVERNAGRGMSGGDCVEKDTGTAEGKGLWGRGCRGWGGDCQTWIQGVGEGKGLCGMGCKKGTRGRDWVQGVQGEGDGVSGGYYPSRLRVERGAGKG